MLAQEADVRVVAECDTGPEALDAIRRFRPDVAFVSVRLPLLGGFEIARAVIPSVTPGFVFLTNETRHALMAFSVSALDCLPIPATRSRVAVTLKRARERLTPQRLSAMMLAAAAESLEEVRQLMRMPPAHTTRGDVDAKGNSDVTGLFVERDGKKVFLPVGDIDFLQSNGGVTIARVGRERLVARDSLRTLEQLLGHGRFVRISRSIVVNTSRVAQVLRTGSRASTVCLEDGTNLRVGARYRFALRNATRSRE